MGPAGVAERFDTIDARLRLAGPGLGRTAEPFELRSEEVLTVCLGAIGMSEPVCFGLQIGVPTTLVAVHPALIDFERSIHHPVEDIAVVRDQKERAAVLLAQVGFQPFDRVGVEVVGGLIENRQGGLLDQEPRERYPPPLAAAHLIDAAVHLAKTELLKEHVDATAVLPASEPLDLLSSGRLRLGVRFPSGLLCGDPLAERLVSLKRLGPGAEPFEHDISRVPSRRQRRFLGQVTNGRFTPACDPPGVRLLFTDQDARQGRLARAVVPNQPHPLPFVNR